MRNEPLQEHESFHDKSLFKSESEAPVADQVCRGKKNEKKSPVPNGNGNLLSPHADIGEDDTRDSSEDDIEPENLLADSHVQKILFLNGLYSVRFRSGSIWFCDEHVLGSIWFFFSTRTTCLCRVMRVGG